ncbi:MAG: DUF4115 domain-containing protein [Kangiellaceae bacterium]|nr:DUF4115 domain-containing protein [Kangiellaceae bacterium]
MTDKTEEQVNDIQFAPGSLLKQAREQQSLSVADVAQQLKLTIQKIEQIEADHYPDDLPAAFYRGYLRNYAELVGLDEDDIAENFANFCKRNNLSASQAPSFKKIQVEKTVNSNNWLMKLVSGLVILALLYSVYYFAVEKKVWQKWLGKQPAEQTELLDNSSALSLENSQDAPLNELSLSENNAGEPVQELALDSKQGDLSVQNHDEFAQQATEVGLTPVQQEAADSSIADTGALTVTTEAQLSLVFSDDCWVRVQDAAGKVLALGIKQGGSSLALNGQAPYKLTLGKASVVELTYNGLQVDLSNYSDSKPARLTLGQ